MTFTAHARREGKKRLWEDVPSPFNVGQREVLNYFGVVELCAMAAKLRATGSL